MCFSDLAASLESVACVVMETKRMHCLEPGAERVVPVIFPTKADEILSKYRPIAPKPLVSKQEEDFGSNCSTITGDIGSKKTAAAGGQLLVNGLKKQRSRKRSATSGFLPRSAAKYLCGSRRRFDKNYNLGQAAMMAKLEDWEQVGMGAKSGCGSASDASYRGYNSHAPGLPLGPSPGSNNIGSVSSNPFTAIKVGAVKAMGSIDTEGMGSKACSIAGKDEAFMERAAERASSTVRSIIYSDIAATVTSPGSMGYGGDSFSSRFPALVAPAFCHGIAEEEEKEASSEEEELSSSSKKDLITLSLFPQEPLRSTELPLSSSNAEDGENREADAPHLTQLRLCAARESYGGADDANPPAMIATNELEYKIDTASLDRMYMATEDAATLMGEANQVLWSNTAFKKAVAERLSHKKNQSAHFYIDVLGLPISLAKYTFQPSPGASECKGTLFGFLKRLVCHRGDLIEQRPFSGLPNVPACFVNGLNATPSSKSVASFVSPPMEAFTSTISLECVTEVRAAFVPTSTVRKLRLVKDQLEQSPLPAVVADGMSRVRWINTAYRMMMGQGECSWLATTFSDGSSSASERLAGEVKLVCANDQPPLTAAAFSCIASVSWSNADIKKSVTVSCDVRKLVDDDDQSFFAWKFYITAADLRKEWLPQASYPCPDFADTYSLKFRNTEGSISHAFTQCMTPCFQRVYS
ncbi:hypothetical protein O6H91_03G017900 [Diphasiastrum complanatum]|uniref:Uncharacterized protein n=1 Tax=Diphasiastrum complanatum TaxID=34168 RepID=A0ACC2E3V9_DIPCM|nr:hypothetical protein O6H91_03G017900 [Diphasiastrum complanatum]